MRRLKNFDHEILVLHPRHRKRVQAAVRRQGGRGGGRH